MSKHLVFVYGTLRRGGLRAMQDVFPNAKFVGGATVGGRLYDLGEYPGLLLGGSDSPVAGEVYEVDDEVLDEMDAIEASDDYRRRRVEVSLGEGVSACWVYVGERGPEFYSRHSLITSGDWIAHAATKTRGRGDARPDEAESEKPSPD